MAGVVDEPLGITAKLGKRRPWSEKWKEIETAYQALIDVYSTPVSAGDTKAWESTALTFFRTCHELPEAIAADGSVPEAIQRTARRVAERRAPLRLVADVDNTRKHGGRDPDKCYAHIDEMSWRASRHAEHDDCS